MNHRFDRRSLLRRGLGWGAGVLLAGRFGQTAHALAAGAVERLNQSARPDLAVVTGDDYAAAATEAVRLLGGMARFVSKGARVAILPNAQRNNPGVYTSPAVVRAVVRMCRAAGAREVNCLTWLPEKNSLDTGLADAVRAEGAKLVLVDMKDPARFRPVPVPRGVALKEAAIMDAFFDHDVLINLPITKDHAGNKFTGTLKNLMGLNAPLNNRTFHRADWQTNPDSIAHLEQCIADLNTVITPTLCLVDATEFIITNGPFGPGELLKRRQVVAGTDRVAIDSYCCTLWGLKPGDIVAIQRAAAHGLGEKDSGRIRRVEKSL